MLALYRFTPCSAISVAAAAAQIAALAAAPIAAALIAAQIAAAPIAAALIAAAAHIAAVQIAAAHKAAAAPAPNRILRKALKVKTRWMAEKVVAVKTQANANADNQCRILLKLQIWWLLQAQTSEQPA